MPTTLRKSYTLPSGSSWSIVSGNTVNISSSGKVTPRNTTWYWTSSYGTTTKPSSGDYTTTVDLETGDTVVKVTTSAGSSYNITFTVTEYAVYYTEKVMDDYLAANITAGMTDSEKVQVITKFPAQYDYSASYSGYVGMVVFGGGDCWASTSAIIRLATKLGLPAKARYGAADGGAGSGHRNAVVLADGKVWECEAGYSGTAPRYSFCAEMPYGLSLRYASDNKVSVYQYDGFDTKVTIPSTITLGGTTYTVTAIADGAFCTNYCSTKIESLTLPSTITSLGRAFISGQDLITTITVPKGVTTIASWAFKGAENLKTITVSSYNTAFKSVNGVVFSKDGTTLVAYPGAKRIFYAIPSTVTTIAAGSIGHPGPTSVVIPSSVKTIGEEAFCYCNLNNIFFKCSKPTFGQYSFAGLASTASIFYPNGKASWSGTTLASLTEADVLTNSEAKLYAWKATEKYLIGAKITLSNSIYNYTGSAIKPTPTVTLNGVKLVKDTDYTVSYEDNVNTGTATLYVKGKGAYAGRVKTTFTIGYKQDINVSLAETIWVYSGKAIKPSVSVTDSWGTPIDPSYYKVTYSNNTAIGKGTVKVSFRRTTWDGSIYFCDKTLSFTINPARTTDVTATPGTTSMTVKWTPALTGAKVTGYQVKFLNTKTGTVSTLTVKGSSASSCKRTGLTAGRTYKVYVRAYKVVGEKTYCGNWSYTKSVTTKK